LDRVHLFEGDFNNEVDLERAIHGADYVFHLISSTLPATSNDNPIYDVEFNLIGTIRLLTLHCS
jgi:UDP-glucose 4-epimerase